MGTMKNAIVTIEGIECGMTYHPALRNGKVWRDMAYVVAVIMPTVNVMERPFELRSTYHINIAPGLNKNGAIDALYNVLECTIRDYLYNENNVTTVSPGK
jgi:hypothetical protein